MSHSIVFVRHCKAKIQPDLHPSNWKLDASGVDQSDNIADFINQNFDDVILFSSPELKAIQTLENYAQNHDKNIEVFEGLGELHFNTFITEYDEFLQHRRSQFIDPKFSINGSEKPITALRRFEHTIREIEVKFQGYNIVICSHGTILSLYFGKLLGINGEDLFYQWKQMKFGAIGIIHESKVQRSIFE